MEGSGNGASLSVGTLLWEPGGRAPLLGTPKDMLNKTLEMSVSFHRGHVLRNMVGRLFLRAFERRKNFFRSFIEEFERHVKEGSENGQISP
jgi:hypothetical protein